MVTTAASAMETLRAATPVREIREFEAIRPDSIPWGLALTAAGSGLWVWVFGLGLVLYLFPSA
jgi:hypothetical protein